MTERSRGGGRERRWAVLAGAVAGGSAVGAWVWVARQRLLTRSRSLADRYQAERRAVSRLQELDTLKTVFLSTASHELRTPATAISGFASLLAESWDRFDDEQRLDFVNRIAANARSLSAVVQDLLDFSFLDTGSTNLVLQPVGLVETVRSVVDWVSATITAHEVVLELDEAVLEVQAEAHGVERIVTNLLTNAAKFSPVGSRVTVGVAAAEGGGAVLWVSDEGPGVPPEERELIFDRFYRGQGEAVVQTRGVGIGLSVVAELAERASATVAVRDAPGGGACFEVRFPNREVVNT